MEIFHKINDKRNDFDFGTKIVLFHDSIVLDVPLLVFIYLNLFCFPEQHVM